MAGRYLVTGVQLAMLSIDCRKKGKEAIKEIIANQFVGNTDNTDVAKDAKRMEELF